MKIVSLVSAVNQNIEELVKGICLETDAVVVNQCETDDSGSLDVNNHKVYWRKMNARGVGLSRNTCIEMTPECDIALFTDEDITYDEGYSKLILDEFMKHPEADVLLFNVRVCDARRTYWNDEFGKINMFNYGRYPAYSIAIRHNKLKESAIKFPLEFGGGAKYINGEDSVFLHDCLEAGLHIYKTPVCIGEEAERESTWFSGYNDRFFISRGALYVRLYGKLALFRAYVFLLRHRYMFKECGFGRAIRLMKQGMKEIRNAK